MRDSDEDEYLFPPLLVVVAFVMLVVGLIAQVPR